MNASALSYAVVTPAHDEEPNLRRLAESLARQTVLPLAWVVVDDASNDGTARVVGSLSCEHPWVRLERLGSSGPAKRGAPIVRAFHAGLPGALSPHPDVVVKLDADLSFEPTYFEGLLARFAADDALGLASGVCLERDSAGQWKRRFGTGTGVWGACRAYRTTCLAQILPLEERQGWDEIDALKAVVRGWRTAAFQELPFYHHRREGERDGSRVRVWSAQGEVAHFIGYRPTYVLMRAFFRARSEPAALALAAGYLRALVGRGPRLSDAAAVAHLRETQRLRHLRVRAREARGLAALTPTA